MWQPSCNEERQHGETFLLRPHRVSPDNNRDDGAAPGVQALRCGTAGEDPLRARQGAVHLPDAVQIFDHFHIVKLMNEKLDKVRRNTYNQETDENKRRLIKGQRWLLLANADNLSPKAEERLYKALDINRPLATPYYLKESLRRVWWQDNKQDAATVLDDWIEQARLSGLKPIESMADTLSRHRSGILTWYDYRISNGKLEGINNKIKTMKRQAYGYRDMSFF